MVACVAELNHCRTQSCALARKHGYAVLCPVHRQAGLRWSHVSLWPYLLRLTCVSLAE